MAIWNDPQPQSGFGASSAANPQSLRAAAMDAGLRRYMLSIYNYMASGVLLSGVVALVVSQAIEARNPLAIALLFSPLRWLVILSPFGFIMAMNIGFSRMQTSTVQALFWAFCGVMGISMASIFLVFTGQSIAATFFVAAGSFAGLSLVGYTTKRSLSGLGSFLIMGLWGLIITMLVAMFVPSLQLNPVISVLGVLIFAGLTAYDTQRLKGMYWQVGGSAYEGKLVVMGALSLYLDFINLFQFLLSFMGDRR